MEMDRRAFLLLAASPLYAGPLVLLSAGEAKLVDALTNQIIPADDAAGRFEAGVVILYRQATRRPAEAGLSVTYARCSAISSGLPKRIRPRIPEPLV